MENLDLESRGGRLSFACKKLHILPEAYEIVAMSRATRVLGMPLMGLLALFLPAYLALIRPVQLHYWQMSRQRCAMDEKMQQLRKQNRANIAVLAGFARQMNFRQHILRQRLGYAEADEMVYIFEDSHDAAQER
jgi:cell division protein FtsB